APTRRLPLPVTRATFVAAIGNAEDLMRPSVAAGGRALSRKRQIPRSLHLLSDVELQLPALLVVAAAAPQLQGAHLSDLAVQVDGPRLALAVGRLQGGAERAHLLDLVLPVLDQGAHGVAAAHARPQEAELRRRAHHQAELLPRHVRLGPLLHA